RAQPTTVGWPGKRIERPPGGIGQSRATLDEDGLPAAATTSRGDLVIKRLKQLAVDPARRYKNMVIVSPVHVVRAHDSVRLRVRSPLPGVADKLEFRGRALTP